MEEKERRYFYIDSYRCRGCKRCMAACPKQAIHAKISLRARQLKINQDECVGCGTCAITCPWQTIVELTKQQLDSIA